MKVADHSYTDFLETKRISVEPSGFELKPEYHKLGVKHLQEAEAAANAPDLFMWAEMQQESAP